MSHYKTKKRCVFQQLIKREMLYCDIFLTRLKALVWSSEINIRCSTVTKSEIYIKLFLQEWDKMQNFNLQELE